MKPTVLGVITIIFGLAIVGLGAWGGGNIIVMGVGLLFIAAGGMTGKRPQPYLCPFCRSKVDPAASVCVHCQRAITPAFNTVCANCGRAFATPPAALGHLARCPHCKKMIPTKRAAA